MTKVFQKRVEDFICEHCGAEVKGTGYTNHCPKCLWSKHVDEQPGDRASACLGMMQPVAVRVTREGYDVQHRCVTCGHERWNKSAPDDNVDLLIKISVAKIP